MLKPQPRRPSLLWFSVSPRRKPNSNRSGQDNKNSAPLPPPPTPPRRPSFGLEPVRNWSEGASHALRTRANELKLSLTRLGPQLNQLTGYGEIEALKKTVIDQELKLRATRQAAKDAKSKYTSAVVKRSDSQKEVNDLLQRKSNWHDGDVSRFTTLVRLDHAYEQEEAEAKAAVDAFEEAVDREFSELMRSILARYHEEQIWSDKIRSASTYGSLAVLGLNVFVFVMAIVVVEPWKRKRLAMTFEKKVEEMSELNKATFTEGFAVLGRKLEEQRSFLNVATQREGEANTPAETVPGDAIKEPPIAKMMFLDTKVVVIAAASAFLAGGVGWLLGKLF